MFALDFFNAVRMQEIVPRNAFQIKLFVAQIVFAAVKQKKRKFVLRKFNNSKHARATTHCHVLASARGGCGAAASIVVVSVVVLHTRVHNHDRFL